MYRMSPLLVLVAICTLGHVTCYDVIINIGSLTPGQSSNHTHQKSDLVAFSVASRKSFAPTTPSRIPFEVINYNKGGYFHSDNAFHAPVNGVYTFTFSATSQGSKRVFLTLHTEKPGQAKIPVASAFDYSSSGQHGGASGSVMVAMESGEMASLWQWGDSGGTFALWQSGLPHGPATLFSGKLEQKLED